MSAIIPQKLVLHEEMDPLSSQVQRVKYESKAGTAKPPVYLLFTSPEHEIHT